MVDGDIFGTLLSGVVAIKLIEKTVDVTEELAISELEGVEGDITD